MIPKAGVPIDFCPGLRGVRNLASDGVSSRDAGALHPHHAGVSAERLREVEQKEGGSGYAQIGHRMLRGYPHPASPQHRGGFLAMDIGNGRILWRNPLTTSPTSAALTTGGGLAIVGDASRYLYVHDAATGTILFRMRMPVPVQGFPITYAVRGRQYLAVPVGTGGFVGDMSAASGATSQNGIYVFALPEAGPVADR